MCAELSAQGHGPPHCETKQDCLDALPQHLGLLIDSIVCGNGAPYGVTHKSCFQVCNMQPDGTHTVNMQMHRRRLIVALIFAARAGDFACCV